jgi:hypothetical protein
MDKTEQQYYERAMGEVLQKKPIPAVMAKAFSDAMGDRDAAVALYIKYRFDELKNEAVQESARQAALERRRRAYKKCPYKNCGHEGYVLQCSGIKPLILVVLLLCGIVPGLIYLAVARSYYICPSCHMKFF